jgi:hypothetical protein
MNPCDLFDYVRSGPTELKLFSELRPFGRRNHFLLNEVIIDDDEFSSFLQALKSSETIRAAICLGFCSLGITQDQWIRLVNTLGSINDIQQLQLVCQQGSRDFFPLSAVASAVNNSQSLRQLKVVVPQDSQDLDRSGLVVLANTLRQHAALEVFVWTEQFSRRESQDQILDPVLRALSDCPHLREVVLMTKCASTDAIRNLLRSSTLTSLHLIQKPEHWLVVADEIRHGRCNIRNLMLSTVASSSSEATESIVAIANAIKLQRHGSLESLTLQMGNGFTDKATMAVADALTVNQTLRKVSLTDKVRPYFEHVETKDCMGAQAYEAFSKMLQVNTSVNLYVPAPNCRAASACCKVRTKLAREHYRQLCIEQRLNTVGRGNLLASSPTTREAWVNALHDLNTRDNDDHPSFHLGSLYTLLQLNPAVCELRK